MHVSPARAPINYLGVATNVHHHQFGVDVLNLSSILYFPFVPVSLDSFLLVLCLDALAIIDTGKPTFDLTLHLTDTATGNTGTISSSLILQTSQTAAEGVRVDFTIKPIPPEVAKYRGPRDILVTIPMSKVAVTAPTTIQLRAELANQLYDMGQVVVGVFAPSPISPEERKAIASRSDAAGVVMATVGCKCANPSCALMRR